MDIAGPECRTACLEAAPIPRPVRLDRVSVGARALGLVTGVITALIAVTVVAQETPQKPEDAPHDPDSVFDLNAEYRVRTVEVSPYDLSGTDVKDVLWTEQRLRLDLGLTRKKLGGVTLQIDVLDGVLFGDNGQFGKSPAPNSGVSLATKRPNAARWAVGLPPGADPLDPDSYVPVLQSAPLLDVNFAYADVILPVGLLRVGRQPQAYGANITSHDGSRVNRWGVSYWNDTSDRILFGTAVDAIVEVLSHGPGYVPAISLDRGFFVAGFYDWLNQGSVFSTDDNLGQLGMAFQWRTPEADWFGLDWRDVLISGFAVHLSDERFATDVWGFPTRTQATVGPFYLLLQTAMIVGESREISEGFAVLSRREPTLQTIQGFGMHALADYKAGPVTMTLQFDYATGDDDPRPTTPITSFSFARDRNVGLLLFEHILAFESARSVGVGIENLASLDAASFPLTEVQTDGRFNNTIALFPQVKVDLLERPNNSVHVRLGALFAWPEADGVVDPILTILNEDGNRIDDDAVNFHGGAPGSYYGTELDAQLEWAYRETFLWTVEGAVLFPGSSLEDENRDAVNAFMVENRFTFMY